LTINDETGLPEVNLLPNDILNKENNKNKENIIVNLENKVIKDNTDSKVNKDNKDGKKTTSFLELQKQKEIINKDYKEINDNNLNIIKNLTKDELIEANQMINTKIPLALLEKMKKGFFTKELNSLNSKRNNGGKDIKESKVDKELERDANIYNNEEGEEDIEDEDIEDEDEDNEDEILIDNEKFSQTKDNYKLSTNKNNINTENNNIINTDNTLNSFKSTQEDSFLINKNKIIENSRYNI